jgi:hypothetical protein
MTRVRHDDQYFVIARVARAAICAVHDSRQSVVPVVMSRQPLWMFCRPREMVLLDMAVCRMSISGEITSRCLYVSPPQRALS